MLRILEEKYNLTDKQNFTRGKWDREPDFLRLVDDRTWLPCVISRQMLGTLNGYVGVMEGNKLYGRDYNEIDINVHGGLIFAGFSPEWAKYVWFLGFDTAHHRDYIPYMESYSSNRHDYRDINYLIKELESLVERINIINNGNRD